MTQLKQITFDLDDTLWPVRPVIEKAEQRYFQRIQELIPAFTDVYDLDKIRAHRWQLLKESPELGHNISAWRINALTSILREFGASQSTAQKISEQAFDTFIEARQEVELFDGVERCLETLSKQFSLGVLTNGNADIRKMAIGRHFDFAFRAEELGESKPGLALFHAALKHNKLPAEKCLHIGDCEHNDVAPALAIGMATARVDIIEKQLITQGKKSEHTASLANFRFTDWKDLPELIAAL